MEAAEATRSSTNELSSAPNSDAEGLPAAYLASRSNGKGPTHPTANDHVFSVGGGVAPSSTAPPPNRHPGDAPAALSTASDRQASAPAKAPRKPRAKKEPSATGSSDVAKEKEKEKRSRRPKVPGAVPTARKKPKLEAAPPGADVQACLPHPNQPLITSAMTFHSPAPPATNAPPTPAKKEALHLPQNGFSMQDPSIMHTNATPKPLYNPISLNGSPTSSTNMYDPVRSMNVQRPSTATPQPQFQQSPTPHPRPMFNPSASPSISSIIDPPLPTPYVSPSSLQHRPDADIDRPVPASAALTQPDRSNTTATELQNSEPGQADGRRSSLSTKPAADENGNAPAQKQPRAKEQPPPMPQGSGLLSSSLFGAGASAGAPEGSDKVPNIVLHVDLKGQKNKIINFARLAEEKYGFAALYPRLAAQNERLARVAAAGAALERSASGSRVGGTSAGDSGDDDASVDIDRDSDNDGDIAMSGLNGNTDAGGNSGTDGATTKRRRRKKIEDYDQEDPFVDDSELVWESQAAASKDGFFVYCGPLVPEGEKPAVERADGTIKRGRGRGRGGGVGSRGGRGAASAGNASEQGTARAGGPGSRGGNTTRKPRMTKAGRANLEKEKMDREKMAPIAAKPVGYPS